MPLLNSVGGAGGNMVETERTQLEPMHFELSAEALVHTVGGQFKLGLTRQVVFGVVDDPHGAFAQSASTTSDTADVLNGILSRFDLLADELIGSR